MKAMLFFVLAGSVLAACEGDAGTASLGDGNGSTTSAPPPPISFGRWETLAPMPEQRPRFYVGVAAAQDRIFVVGGWTQGEDLVSAFDTRRGEWVPIAPLPARFGMPNVAAVGNRLFVVGARENRTTVEYDFASNSWQPRAPMPAEQGRGAAAVGVSGPIVFLAGGLTDGLSDNMLATGRRQADAYAYDSARDRWETLLPLPEAVGYAMGAVLDNRFYVMGGSTNVTRTSSSYVYDPGARTWTTIEPLPRDVSSAGVAVMRGRIVIVGGIATAVGQIAPDTQVFDPTTKQWSTVAPMTTPRFGMGAAVSNDRLYVPGGVAANNTAAMFGPIPTLEVFTP